VQLILRHFGLDPQQDAQYLAIGEEGVLWESLKLGRVQAVPVAPPFPALAEREGYRLLANAAELFAMPSTGVSASAAKLGADREQIVRLVAAEIEALRFIHGDRSATVALIAQRFEMDHAIAERSYELVIASYATDGRLSREGLQLLLELDQAAGALPEIPPLERMADFALVDEALARLATQGSAGQ
jgi:ABC-type nitrate/sulfonate/bicarbonate transport system substrate-binding protein